MNFKQPIAIFAFRRPKHLERVLEVVRKVRPQKVYFYIDQPKAASARSLFEDWEQVVKLVKDIDWIPEKYVNIAQESMGCKKRISSGIVDILSKEETAVFLEDDCLPDFSFFEFCEFNLEHFKNNSDILTITGFNPLNEMNVKSDIIFSDYPHIWGWATWKRFLKVYDVDMKNWSKDKILIKDNLRLSKEEKKFWSYFLQKVANGKVDTWDAQVTYASLIHNKINIYPRLSLIQNIGFDAAGTHVKNENVFTGVKSHHLAGPYRLANEIEVNESFDRERGVLEYNLPPFKVRLFNKLRSFFK